MPSTHKITVPRNLAESRVFQGTQRKKRAEIIKAVQFCRDNNCKGWRCLAENNFQYLKSPLTINKYLKIGVCAARSNRAKR